MAKLYPDYDGDYSGIASSAEVKLYEACKGLKGDFHIFHSVAWISRSEGEARDGEADFLVCHPNRGFLVIEVKGGRIEADYSNGRWTSIDGRNRRHQIKDPFQQGVKAKFGILTKLKEQRDWDRLGVRRVEIGHAAFFPDVSDGRRLQGPNAPPELIGDANDLGNLGSWLDDAFDYWADRESGATTDPLGPGGIQLIARVFARVVEARPLIATHLEQEERKRLELTDQQVKLLDYLARKRRVAIGGGAGTGKTVLATEKARRLANEGFKTLLTCYNKPLASHLAQLCADQSNLDVINFHGLCKDTIDEAGRISGRDLITEAKSTYPGKDLWSHYFPIALAYALDVVDKRYDAIVVDEGQDFEEEFWLPLECMLEDAISSPLYVFEDENQNIYKRVSTFPIPEAPFHLNTNCRNTKNIHRLAYRYYKGDPVEASSIDGHQIETIIAPGIDSQARKIRDHVSRLMVDEKVSPRAITVLVADRPNKKRYQDALKRFALSAGANWASLDNTSPRGVVVETVARFKGLETDILILWGLDEPSAQDYHSELYVGSSRAKSILALCGTRKTCEAILKAVQPMNLEQPSA